MAVFRATKISSSSVIVADSSTEQICGVDIPPLYSGLPIAKLSVFATALFEQQIKYDAKLHPTDKRFHLVALPPTSTISFAIVQNVNG